MAKTIIGIDPGASGGIAVYVTSKKLTTHKMPRNADIMCDFFSDLSRNRTEVDDVVCFIEAINLRPGDLKVGFAKLLRNMHRLEFVMELHQIPTAKVYPQQWQKIVNAPKGMEYQDRKRAYRDIGKDAFPNCKVTLWNADALWIMKYGYQQIITGNKKIKKELRQSVKYDLFH